MRVVEIANTSVVTEATPEKMGAKCHADGWGIIRLQQDERIDFLQNGSGFYLGRAKE